MKTTKLELNERELYLLGCTMRLYLNQLAAYPAPLFDVEKQEAEELYSGIGKALNGLQSSK